MSKTTLAVLIGRFQPFHDGHAWLLQQALDRAGRVLILLGSADQPRNIRNVWRVDEREAMIRAAMPDVAAERLLFEGVADVLYDIDVWAGFVRAAVAPHADDADVLLLGHSKDSTSFYLRLFPHWRYQELPNYQHLSATPMRRALLDAGPRGAGRVLANELSAQMPAGTLAWLTQFTRTPDFARICEEAAAVRQFQRSWDASPYPPVFVTVDALVRHRDAILLVSRGHHPGKGQWALPGGFVDPQERLQAAVRRELAEETGLDLAATPHEVAVSRIYDAPERSTRGRFITQVTQFEIDAAQPRPAVRGGDDAASAFWLPLAELDPARMFEDHYCIIMHALDLYRAEGDQ